MSYLIAYYYRTILVYSNRRGILVCNTLFLYGGITRNLYNKYHWNCRRWGNVLIISNLYSIMRLNINHCFCFVIVLFIKFYHRDIYIDSFFKFFIICLRLPNVVSLNMPNLNRMYFLIRFHNICCSRIEYFLS